MPYNPIPWLITMKKPLKLQRCHAIQVIKFWELIAPPLPPSHYLSPPLGEGGWVGSNERHLCCCPKQLLLLTPPVCLTRNLPDQYLWTACNLLSSYHSISRGPMSCVLNIKELYTSKIETIFSSETFITSYQMTASQSLIIIYTGCFTTLGHNCRRWFPRSL